MFKSCGMAFGLHLIVYTWATFHLSIGWGGENESEGVELFKQTVCKMAKPIVIMEHNKYNRMR